MSFTRPKFDRTQSLTAYHAKRDCYIIRFNHRSLAIQKRSGGNVPWARFRRDQIQLGKEFAAVDLLDGKVVGCQSKGHVVAKDRNTFTIEFDNGNRAAYTYAGMSRKDLWKGIGCYTIQPYNESIHGPFVRAQKLRQGIINWFNTAFHDAPEDVLNRLMSSIGIGGKAETPMQELSRIRTREAEILRETGLIKARSNYAGPFVDDLRRAALNFGVYVEDYADQHDAMYVSTLPPTKKADELWAKLREAALAYAQVVTPRTTVDPTAVASMAAAVVNAAMKPKRRKR